MSTEDDLAAEPTTKRQSVRVALRALEDIVGDPAAPALARAYAADVLLRHARQDDAESARFIFSLADEVPLGHS